MAKSFHVRLDEAQEAEVQALIAQHSKGMTLGKVTVSDILRAALHEMYVRQLEAAKPTRKPRKAPADAT